MDVRELTRLAMLFAIALLMMVLEGMIPPIPSLPPGVKLGLSNIVVMYALFYLGKRPALTLAVLKSLFVFLARGGMTAFFMSLGGGLFSILVMILLLGLKKVRISYIIISVCAAIAHNMAQLVVAGIYMQTAAVWFYAPVLVLSGVAMGCVTGVLLRVLMPAMERIQVKPKAAKHSGSKDIPNSNDTGGHNGDHQQ